MFINARMYTVIFTGVSVSAVQDLIAVVAAAGKNCYLCGLELGQTGTADYGDAQEEGVGIRCRSGQTTVGSGGGAYTPVPINVTDAAAGFTARINDTTIASAGTIVTHWTNSWNPRMPFIWEPPPHKWIPLTGGRRATFEIDAAPADALSTMRATAWILEVG